MDEISFDGGQRAIFDDDHVMIFLHGIDDVMKERFFRRLGRRAVLRGRVRRCGAVAFGHCEGQTDEKIGRRG